MKQTAASSDPRMVLFLGDDNSLVNLGTFHDLVYKHKTNEEIMLSVTWHEKFPFDHFPFDRPITFSTFVSELQGRIVLSGFRYTFESGYLGVRLVESESEKYELDSQNGTLIGYSAELAKLKPIRFYSLPLHLPGVIITNNDEERTVGFAFEIRLEQHLERISYLGPLRDHPHRTYLWGGDSPSDVGKRGERAIAALLSARVDEKGTSIEQKIAEWMKKMGLIHSFRLRPIAPNRRDYEVVIQKTPTSSEVLITDVGFGVSQILPVLVLCYYVPEGSTIIFEQPEIHLHPSVQADLADVFIDVAKNRNVQIIFESHSEYLLHRLQRRIAEEALDNDQTALYFCSMDEEGRSHATNLEIDDYGNIANWPPDFFGDATGDLVAMTRAAMQRKMASQP